MRLTDEELQIIRNGTSGFTVEHQIAWLLDTIDGIKAKALISVKRGAMRHPPCPVECRCDGNQVGAMIGPNIQEGVVGYGDNLAEALRALANELEREVGHEPEEGRG